MTGSFQSQAVRAGVFAFTKCARRSFSQFPSLSVPTGRTLAVPSTNVKAISLFI